MNLDPEPVKMTDIRALLAAELLYALVQQGGFVRDSGCVYMGSTRDIDPASLADVLLSRPGITGFVRFLAAQFQPKQARSVAAAPWSTHHTHPHHRGPLPLLLLPPRPCNAAGQSGKTSSTATPRPRRTVQSHQAQPMHQLSTQVPATRPPPRPEQPATPHRDHLRRMHRGDTSSAAQRPQPMDQFRPGDTMTSPRPRARRPLKPGPSAPNVRRADDQ